MPGKSSPESRTMRSDFSRPDDGWEQFRLITKIMDAERIAGREKVREAVRAAGVPLPENVVKALAQLNPHDVRKVLIDHPGFETSERLRSYRSSLTVFQRAVSDLTKAIERFESAVKGDIFDRQQRDELGDIKGAIQKELFAATNAAISLRDHSTRRLQPLVKIPGYEARRNECFGNDGLHEFIIGFRNVLHHLHMIEAGWHVENHFERGKKASFKVNRDEVRFYIEHSEKRRSKTEHASILAYLSASPKDIDLKKVFEEYQERVADFHTWYGEALTSDHLIELRDCERCLQESRKFGARTFWKAMLGNWLRWKRPPNPYDHLHRYLTSEQIADVYSLPMQSEKQVDKVIKFVDTGRACDAELRRMAYELFRRATPP